MTGRQAEAEVFWLAFRSLPKMSREAVVARLMKDRDFASELEDIVLIERARKEKGEDISFARKKVIGVRH